MTSEEFQRLVLEKLENLDDKVKNLEQGQKDIKKDLESIIERTADLSESEFRSEINEKMDKLAEELNMIEIVTSKNWNEITRLKAAK